MWPSILLSCACWPPPGKQCWCDVIRWSRLGANGVKWRCAVVLRRQSTIKRDNRIMWYDSMQNAIKQTIIISEILDTRTRHLIQVCLASHTSRCHISQLALKSPKFQLTLSRPALLTHALAFPQRQPEFRVLRSTAPKT